MGCNDELQTRKATQVAVVLARALASRLPLTFDAASFTCSPVLASFVRSGIPRKEGSQSPPSLDILVRVLRLSGVEDRSNSLLCCPARPGDMHGVVVAVEVG